MEWQPPKDDTIKNLPEGLSVLPGRGEIGTALGRAREHIVMASFSERFAVCGVFIYGGTLLKEVDWNSIILCQNCKRGMLSQHISHPAVTP